MTTELTVLALAGLLQVVQFSIYSVLATQQVGFKTSTGPRDEPTILKGTAGRAQRAMNNHFEGLTLFTLAVVVVTLGDASNAVTAICALVYLAARIAYVPAYLLGLAPWRSYIWMAALLATFFMILAALF